MWLFVDVEITGWSRGFLLFLCCFMCLAAVLLLLNAIISVHLSIMAYIMRENSLGFMKKSEDVSNGEDPEIQARIRKVEKHHERLHAVAWIMWIYSLLAFAFTIPGAEKIIAINNLSPQRDLSQPGQLIPFTIGIVTLMDGIFALIRRLRLAGKKGTTPDNNELRGWGLYSYIP